MLLSPSHSEVPFSPIFLVYFQISCAFPTQFLAVPHSSTPGGQRMGRGMQVGAWSSPSMGCALLVRGEQLSVSPVG